LGGLRGTGEGANQHPGAACQRYYGFEELRRRVLTRRHPARLRRLACGAFPDGRVAPDVRAFQNFRSILSNGA